ncbi:glycosyltransferase family 25 protein [bacterium]|nr:glycosyltransferase family 25 protein [bacterium]
MFLGVDKIYVINLRRHSLRKERIIQNLNPLNINYKFIEAIDWVNYKDNLSFFHKCLDKYFFDPNAWFSYGIICCALSHRKAYKEFLDSGEETALFLEDDVEPTKYFSKFNFQRLNNDIKTLNWGVCWLGKNPETIDTLSHVKNDLYEYNTFNNQQFSAHAYILNRKSAQWFYDNTKKLKYAADIRLEICPFKNLTVKESLFVQRHKLLYKDYQFLKNNNLVEFFHSTTEDVIGDTKRDVNKIINSYVHKELPIKEIKQEKIYFNNKPQKGYKFYLNE